MDLLAKTRKINALLQSTGARPVNFEEMADTLSEVIDANVYVVSRKGKLLGLEVPQRVESEKLKKMIDEKQFSQYNLKYLEDPKGSFGGEESIHTIVRKGLKEDMPNAYKILNQFHWDVKDMESVMLEAQETSFEEAAKNWIKANQDKVTQWIKDTEPVNGKSIELVSTPWDTERASSEVLKQVLEKQGFNVKVTPVDPAVVFQAIADGEADASQAPWLPSTHKPFYEKYKDDIVDLGENLKGTRTGLVVPTYMNIDSIDDLQPKDG